MAYWSGRQALAATGCCVVPCRPNRASSPVLLLKKRPPIQPDTSCSHSARLWQFNQSQRQQQGQKAVSLASFFDLARVGLREPSRTYIPSLSNEPARGSFLIRCRQAASAGCAQKMWRGQVGATDAIPAYPGQELFRLIGIHAKMITSGRHLTASKPVLKRRAGNSRLPG